MFLLRYHFRANNRFREGSRGLIETAESEYLGELAAIFSFGPWIRALGEIFDEKKTRG
jgi:hypothetical protein